MVQAPAMSVVMPTVPVVSSSVKTGIACDVIKKTFTTGLVEYLVIIFVLHLPFRMIPRDKNEKRVQMY